MISLRALSFPGKLWENANQAWERDRDRDERDCTGFSFCSSPNVHAYSHARTLTCFAFFPKGFSRRRETARSLGKTMS